MGPDVGHEAGDGVDEDDGEEEGGRPDVEVLGRVGGQPAPALGPDPLDRQGDDGGGERRQEHDGAGPQGPEKAEGVVVHRPEVDLGQVGRGAGVDRHPDEGEGQPREQHGFLEAPVLVARLAPVDPGAPVALHECVLGVPQPGHDGHRGQAHVDADGDDGREHKGAPREEPAP